MGGVRQLRASFEDRALEAAIKGRTGGRIGGEYKKKKKGREKRVESWNIPR